MLLTDSFSSFVQTYADLSLQQATLNLMGMPIGLHYSHLIHLSTTINEVFEITKWACLIHHGLRTKPSYLLIGLGVTRISLNLTISLLKEKIDPRYTKIISSTICILDYSLIIFSLQHSMYFLPRCIAPIIYQLATHITSYYKTITPTYSLESYLEPLKKYPEFFIKTDLIKSGKDIFNSLNEANTLIVTGDHGVGKSHLIYSLSQVEKEKTFSKISALELTSIDKLKLVISYLQEHPQTSLVIEQAHQLFTRSNDASPWTPKTELSYLLNSNVKQRIILEAFFVQTDSINTQDLMTQLSLNWSQSEIAKLNITFQNQLNDSIKTPRQLKNQPKSS